MRSSLALLLGSSILVVACGGATTSDITEGSSTSSGGSGSSSSGASSSASSSGSTSSSSASSSGSTSSSSSSSSSSGGPKACTGTGGQCGASEYCEATACGSGTCKPRPPETGDFVPVCGCDGITYANNQVAFANGASVRSNGLCNAPSPTTTCTGNCPDGPGGEKRYCSALSLGGVATCTGGTPLRRCWVLPKTCTAKNVSRFCGAGAECRSPCDSVKDGRAAYMDSVTCP